MDRTEEKVALAREVGADAYWNTKESEKICKETISKLTAMSFKPITEEEIRNKICNERFLDYNFEFLFGAIMILVVSLIYFLVMTTERDNLWWLMPYALALSTITALLGIRYYRVTLESMPLASWENELPYGALLAVKEAKDKGLGNFTIYYPTKNDLRLKSDPVITGVYLNNNLNEKWNIMVEIFAWDDGKIYE